MRPITRMVAVAAMVAAMAGSGATAASAVGTGIQAQGEVSCGYDRGECVRQWYDYAFVKNYIVSDLYYRGGGYHFYWWN